VIVERRAVRASLLTPEREVLLMRIRPPHGGSPFWITPGGGMEAGETPDEGLRRELREELGLTDFSVGPLVWRRQHTFNWGDRRLCQREEYRIVEIAGRFAPVMSDDIEMKVLESFRWWTLAELVAATENLTPLSLPEIVRRYLDEGAPREPLETEVLVD